MASVALIGSTGLVGSQILTALLALPSVSKIEVLARREPSNSSTSTKLNSFIDADISKWPPHLTSLKPAPDIFISSLATTRAAAGGFDKQYAFEHGFNIEMAKAAKDAGCRVFVLISAAVANPHAFVAYSRMKGEIERDIKALGFEHTVIVHPGLLVGKRQETRVLEGVMRGVANVMGAISSHYLKDGWAQDDIVVGRSAVKAGLMCLNGEAPDTVWELKAAEIVRLGRTEWKE